MSSEELLSFKLDNYFSLRPPNDCITGSDAPFEYAFVLFEAEGP